MSEQVPGPILDEPTGDLGDQASRLQMAQEQEAIQAALSGRVRGTDALEERATTIEPLEGLDPLDRSEVESSDDPLHGGGMPVTDPEESQTSLNHEALTSDLAMTGVAEDGAWMAIDEGGSQRKRAASLAWRSWKT